MDTNIESHRRYYVEDVAVFAEQMLKLASAAPSEVALASGTHPRALGAVLLGDAVHQDRRSGQGVWKCGVAT